MIGNEELHKSKMKLLEQLKPNTGIVGVGLGEHCLRVLVKTDDDIKHVPAVIDGISIEVVVVGQVDAGGE